MIKLFNIRNNFHTLELGNITIWFSYEEPISFTVHHSGESMTRENSWGTTTGKHINLCDADKSARVSGEVFVKRLEELINN